MFTIDLGRGAIKFFNGTAHAVALISGARKNFSLRKHQGGGVLCSIPPSGVVLNAVMAMSIVTDLGSGVNVQRMTYSNCDPLPEAALEADYIIASLPYCKAYRALQMPLPEGVCLVSPRDLVVGEDGFTVRGCCGFVID